MSKYGFVAFIPGLRSKEMVETPEIHEADGGPMIGTTARAVYNAAQANGLAFHQIDVQTRENPFPTLTEMGAIAASRLLHLQLMSSKFGHVVMSSVGAGVGLQALSDRVILPPQSVTTYEGVYDPLSLIPLQAQSTPGGAEGLAAMRAGKIPFFPLPVESPDPTKTRQHFELRGRHMDDATAVRPLSPDPAHQLRLREAFHDRQTPHLSVVAKKDMRLSPPELAWQFARTAGPVVAIKTDVHIIEGGPGNGQHNGLEALLTQQFGQ